MSEWRSIPEEYWRTYRIARAIGTAGVPVGIILVVVGSLMAKHSTRDIHGLAFGVGAVGTWGAVAYLGIACFVAAVVGLIVCWRIGRSA